MRQILLLLFVFFACSLYGRANDLALSDTLSNKKSQLSVLLQSKNHVERVNCINNLYSPAYSGSLKSYSEELQLDSIVMDEWSEESQSIEKSLLYTCHFENNNQNVLVDIFKWNIEENEWAIGDQNYYYFNDKGRLKQIEFREYVYATYKLYTRVDYVYENSLLKLESRFDRIDEIETWSKLVQYEHVYNDNNSLKITYINEWDTYENDWMPVAYKMFAYDSIGNLASETAYDYNSFDAISTKKYEVKYTFEENKLIAKTEYIPGWEEDVFVPEFKQENTYNAASALESETYYNWDYDADNWLGTVKLNYKNEGEGTKIFETTSFLWSKKEMEWEGSQKLEYFSNNNYLKTEIENWQFIETYMPAYSFNGVVCDEIINSNWNDYQWNDSGAVNYFFSKGSPVGIDNMEEMGVKVYPNPIVDRVYIEINNEYEHTCIVRNLQGNKVLQTICKYTTQVNLTHLSSGVYFLELASVNGKTHIQKIIKR